MKKPIISYKITRDGDLLTTSQRIVDKLANNPDFTNPPAAFDNLKKLLPKYKDALVKAKSRDKEMVSVKNDRKETMQELLTQLADYVTRTSKGKLTTILSSGFDVQDERNNALVPVIKTFQVAISNNGEATTCVKKVTGARAYIHQFTVESPGPETMWFGEGSSFRSFTFTKLQSEKRYWFRVVAIGSGGRNAYSPVVSKVIQ